MFLTIIVFILTLLLLVVTHEFGHFIVAKRSGVKVLEFGFGIPPRLWGKKVGETLVSINLLPVGGFVRLFGEDESDSKILKDPRSFAAQPVWERIAVVVAGVSMNIFLSWILFYVVLINQNFQIFYPSPELATTVTSVEKGSPAEMAGIKAGERIISIDSKRVTNIEDVISNLKGKAGKEVKVVTQEANSNRQTTVVVRPKETDGAVRMGVVFPAIPIKQYLTPTEKIFSAPTYSWDLTRFTFQGFAVLIGDLVTGNYTQASQSVAGPVGLAVITNNIVSAGAIFFYLWFVGVLSLTLAVVNILPFPALDGGRLIFLLIEAAIGKRVNPEVERWVHSVGLVILLALFILITFSDIRKLSMP